MDHAALQAQVFALHDGELTGAARQAAETHLRECAACQALAARWQATADALFAAPRTRAMPASEFFVQRVMNRLQDASRAPAMARPRLAWRATWRWLIPVPALGLAVLVAMLLVRPATTSSISVEALLLEHLSGPAAWTLSNQTTTLDDVLDLAMEEPS